MQATRFPLLPQTLALFPPKPVLLRNFLSDLFLASASPTVILFCNRDEPYYEFTNFSESYPITIEGKQYLTTEHFFQAHKFIEHPHLMEKICREQSPM
jgi:predicted NAD-dependent protein-ADP-ribosyltransferase YbiA (DUF1768 family)